MSISKNNPYKVAIISSVISGLVVGIVLYFIFEHKHRVAKKNLLGIYIKNADKLFEKGMTESALSIYQDTTKEVTAEMDPFMYSRINFMKGQCFTQLALVASINDK